MEYLDKIQVNLSNRINQLETIISIYTNEKHNK